MTEERRVSGAGARLRREHGRSLGRTGALAAALFGLGACATTVAGRGGADVAWDAYLGGADSSQYSALDQIDRGNVAELDLAWSYPTGERGAYLFNPLVVDGVMYVLAHQNSLVALNAATGEELWRLANQGPVGARGMNYWESEDGTEQRLFYINGGMLTSVDLDGGHIDAAFGESGRVDLRVGLDGDISAIRPLQTSNPGRVFENLVIVSLPASAFGFASSPGDIHAYDTRTGELVWAFNVVPKEGELGADTWPARDRALFGGGHNWSETTLDVERGIVFVPTGTARFDFYGANRPGDNLFADTILALDARTGERLWHFQTVHHDLWDYDLPLAPKLVTLQREGRTIPALAQPTKTGFVFVLDRRTGEPVFPIEERPVPVSDAPGEQSSPTQPFPTAPPPFARQSFTEADINPLLPEEDQARLREILRTSRNEGLFTPPSLGGTIMMPGHGGGGNWGMAAADAERGLLYIVSKENPTTANLAAPGPNAPAEVVPNADEGFIAYRAPVDFMTQTGGLPPIGPPWSTITAYDLNEGEILWQVPNGEVTPLAEQGHRDTGAIMTRGGPVATGGGLLFVATATDRKLRARDVRNGAVLWEFDLPAASEGVPAVYEVGGRQYVTIPVGGAGQFTRGLGLPDPGPGQYMTFALPE
jgi:quinoprotein glucose dehydrogenase